MGGSNAYVKTIFFGRRVIKKFKNSRNRYVIIVFQTNKNVNTKRQSQKILALTAYD